MLIFVEDASGPVVSPDPEGLDVGYLGWKRLERSGTGQGHMRPVVIMVTLEGRQDPQPRGDMDGEEEHEAQAHET